MTTTDTPRDEKAGWCNMCRAESHTLCGSAKCTCPDMRRHRNRPGFAGRDTAPPAAAKRPAVSAPVPIDRARQAAPPPEPEKPRFRLLKEEPPEPPAKPERVTFAGQIAALVADIPEADSDWWSISECTTPRGASQVAARCRKLDLNGWEWKSAETKVYVRRRTQP